MSRRLIVGVGLAAFAVTATTAALVLFAHDFSPEPLDDSLGQVGVDGIWIVCGLVALARWPDNRTGLLIVALGLADMSNQLFWDASAPIHAVRARLRADDPADGHTSSSPFRPAG